MATQSPTAGKSDLFFAVNLKLPTISASNLSISVLTIYFSLCSDITRPTPNESREGKG